MFCYFGQTKIFCHAELAVAASGNGVMIIREPQPPTQLSSTPLFFHYEQQRRQGTLAARIPPPTQPTKVPYLKRLFAQLSFLAFPMP